MGRPAMVDTGTDDSLRTVLIIVGVILLFPMLMMVFAMPMMGMMGWWWDGGSVGESVGREEER